MGDFDLDSLVGCDVIWGDELFYIEAYSTAGWGITTTGILAIFTRIFTLLYFFYTRMGSMFVLLMRMSAKS